MAVCLFAYTRPMPTGRIFVKILYSGFFLSKIVCMNIRIRLNSGQNVTILSMKLHVRLCFVAVSGLHDRDTALSEVRAETQDSVLLII
jgi:hypothetical protein